MASESFLGAEMTPAATERDLRSQSSAKSGLPVARSKSVAVVFFSSVLITVGILAWLLRLRAHPDAHGMSPIYYFLFSSLDYGGTLATLVVLLGALFLSARAELDRLPQWIGSRPTSFALAVTAALMAGAVFIYRRTALSMDEYTVLFQSQVFAAGHLTGQYPRELLAWLVPLDHSLFFAAADSTGAIASSYWPSFALLLTPFTWLGIPWACNPVLSGLTILAVHRLALRMFGSVESAGVAMLLTIASPVFLADGISYYSMTAHMLANAVFALLLLDATPRRLFAAGVVGSIALTLHNPLPHVLFALPWFVWLALRPAPVRNLSWLVAGYLPLGAALGLGWLWLQVHFGMIGLEGGPYSISSAGSLFGWPNERFFFARIVGFAKLWVWAVPVMLVLAFVGLWRWRQNASVKVMAAAAGSTLLGFMFALVEQGHGWGFRYFHSAWIALPLLAAAAVAPVAQGSSSVTSVTDRDMRALLVACALLTLVVSVPLRLFQIRSFIVMHVSQMPAYASNAPHVTFINPFEGIYVLDLLQNDPFLRGKEIRLLSMGDEADSQAMARLRPAYRRVYADRYGVVWAEPSSPASATNH